MQVREAEQVGRFPLLLLPALYAAPENVHAVVAKGGKKRIVSLSLKTEENVYLIKKKMKNINTNFKDFFQSWSFVFDHIYPVSL